MLVIRNEMIRPFDVDDTLIVSAQLSEKLIHIVDPVFPDRKITMGVHEPMIRLMHEEKHRGAFIIVWSRGGQAWAENVVKALGLEDVVDLVLAKPMVYFDDKDVADWMKDRVYLAPNCEYKK